jgi:hypothetical protein
LSEIIGTTEGDEIDTLNFCEMNKAQIRKMDSTERTTFQIDGWDFISIKFNRENGLIDTYQYHEGEH